MPRAGANSPDRALALQSARELSDSGRHTRSVRSASAKRWQPPEGLSPGEVRAVIAAASSERDRQLLRVLWATGARVSEVLSLQPMDVQRDSLVLPNRKNPNLPVKRVFLPGAELGLTGELLLWAKEQDVAEKEPLFFSRKRGADGARQPLQRGQAWLIVKEATERAGVRVLALRDSKHGLAGEAAPVHPHMFRHARVRQIVRATRIFHSPNAKPDGAGCRWLISPSAMMRHASSCESSPSKRLRRCFLHSSMA
jgi:integrase